MFDTRLSIVSTSDQLLQPTSRRRFLGLLGLGGAIVFLPSVFTGCNDSENTGTNPQLPTFTLDLSNDTGILNYLYALEQLEAGFYTAALTSPGFIALSTTEQEVLTDLQKHEVIHREFFKQLLGGSAIPSISFNATFAAQSATRDALLKTSQLLEDTGVSAYNGAGKYLTTPANLLVAVKIASVEARHSAAIRDIRDGTIGRLFAGDDVVNSSSGLDVKAEPGTVVSAVGTLNVVVGTIGIGTPPDRAKATADQPAPTPV
jgi:hypothetical protein